VILELKDNLNQNAKAKTDADHDAPEINFYDLPRTNIRSALSLFEPFDLLANDKSDRARIGIQNVSRGNNRLASSRVASSPLEIGFVRPGDGVSARSNAHRNGECAILGFQNQPTFGFDVDYVADANFNPSKWISDADQIFSHFYAGLEKKDKNNPKHNQVQRERSQEGSRPIEVKVEAPNQEIDHSHSSSAYQGGKGSVFEVLHELSLTEEEVG
jgi:hypothetical protein